MQALRARTERLRDPSHCWDNRKGKTSPRTPDFKHKIIQRSLWRDSSYNQCWVQEGTHKAQAAEEEEEDKEAEEVKSGTGDGWRIPSLQEALSSLKERGLSQPSVEGFARILRKCRKERNRAHALRLHAYMRKSGLEAHRSLGNYLIQMLVEVGSIRDAHQAFDRLVYRNEWSWNSLIIGCIKCGKLQDALTLYQKMQNDDSIYPNGHIFVAILKICAKLKDLERGLEIHAKVARMGLLETNVFVGNTLVDMYAKCGLLAQAQQVFDKLPFRDIVSWNALITGYVEHRHGKDAVKCFEQMQLEGLFPDAVTFVCILKACGSIGATDKGREIHAEIERRGLLERDLVVGTTLVDMYAKCGCLVKAQQVFYMLPARDVVSWTALIAGYADHGHGEEAVTCFEQMKLEGVSPNAVTFVCILKAYGSIGDTDKGQQIHAEIERQGFVERDLVVGNALVDMYAKYGLLAKAEKIFNRLPIRDVVSWTALIAGYVEHGHGEEAVDCFEQMQLEGVTPNSVTFVCSLKACGSIRAPDKGQKIHAEIERQGLLEKDLVVGTTLVDMYAKCGLLAKARQVFDRLPVQGIVSWNALIAGYGEQGQGEEAVKCFEEMQLEGVSPNAVTFVCTLKACGSIGTTVKGQEIHAEIERQGLLERDLVVSTTLVDMYAKCGWFAKAQQVFDRLPVRDVVSWTALIAGYCEHGHGEEAVKCFNQMQLEGVSPNVVTLVCSLKACGSIGATDKGRQIHAEIERQGLLESDLVVGTTLVDMYAKGGLLAKAQQVFDRTPVRDIVSWNALIAGYAEHGHGEEAVQCFEQMQLEGVFPDAITYIFSLKACSSIGATEKGQKIHAEIERQGLLEGNLVLGNTLVDMYAKCGLFAKAEEVFDKLLVRDTVSWTALIAGYAEHGHGEKAVECFEQMQLERVSPNAVTFVCSLKACGSIGATNKGQEIHVEIERQGLPERDLVVGTTLVDMYAKCGLLTIAKQVFDRLPVRDIVSWTALMAGYAQLGESENVFLMFDRMLEEGIKPNLATFVVLLSACSRTGLFNKSETFFEAMSKDYGIIPALEHHTCMVNLLGLVGLLDNAVAMIKKMPFCPDLVVWRGVLGACRHWGNVEFGKQAFEHAVGLDKKDAIAYVFMSDIYAGADLQEEEMNKAEAIRV